MTQPPPAFGPTSLDDLHDDSEHVYDAMSDAQRFADVSFDPDPTDVPENDYEPDDEPQSGEQFFADFLSADQPEVQPDAKLAEPKPRPPVARKYEKKVRGLFAFGIKVSVQHQKTVPDAATLLLFGPSVSEKLGDLAAVDSRIAHGIDMLTEQTESPTLALMMVGIPMILQLARNHESDIKRTEHRAVRSFRLPFTKKQIQFRFRLRLPRSLRARTEDPVVLARKVLLNPDVVAAFRKQGINPS